MKKMTPEEELAGMRILATRCYPGLHRAGHCSRHREDGHFDCTICYPSWPKLLDAHMEVKEKIYQQVLSLAGVKDPDNGRVGWDHAIELIKKKLEKQPEGSNDATATDGRT